MKRGGKLNTMSPYPLVSKKYKKPSLVSPEQLVKNKNTLPDKIVLCFSKRTALSLRKAPGFKKTISLYKTGLSLDLYQKKRLLTGVVSDFGLGASASVFCLELLRAGGAKKFISLGIVGSLTPDLKVGEKVFIIKAFRDEGCSYHYKRAEPYIDLPLERFSQFKGLKLKPVTSWTTDAPFRETKEEVLYFQSKGVECVDMEASALMAVTEYYKLHITCLGVVSDHLSPQGWKPNFSHPNVKKSLYELLNQILFVS